MSSQYIKTSTNIDQKTDKSSDIILAQSSICSNAVEPRDDLRVQMGVPTYSIDSILLPLEVHSILQLSSVNQPLEIANVTSSLNSVRPTEFQLSAAPQILDESVKAAFEKFSKGQSTFGAQVSNYFGGEIGAGAIFNLIKEAIEDPDRQSVGQEYEDLCRVMKHIVDRMPLSADAMKVWEAFCEKAEELRAKGKTGIPEKDYDELMSKMADVAGISHAHSNHPYMGQEFGINGYFSDFLNDLQKKGFEIVPTFDDKSVVVIKYKGLTFSSKFNTSSPDFEFQIIHNLDQLNDRLFPDGLLQKKN